MTALTALIAETRFARERAAVDRMNAHIERRQRERDEVGAMDTLVLLATGFVVRIVVPPNALFRGHVRYSGSAYPRMSTLRSVERHGGWVAFTPDFGPLGRTVGMIAGSP